jgi:hypothetical protein
MARQFTVEEANALLPTLTSLLEDLLQLRQRGEQVMRDVARFEARAARNGHGENTPIFDPDHDLAGLRREVDQRLLYLQGIGVELKNIEHGIIDFPTRMFGRDVYLCWRLGEDSVSHWHDIDSGFAGRQPL